MKIAKKVNSLIITDNSLFLIISSATAVLFVLYYLIKSILKSGITHIDSIAFLFGFMIFVIIFIKIFTLTKIVLDAERKIVTYEKNI